MKPIILLILIALMTSKATIANHLSGGRAAGLGNAAVALYDFWAVSHNQAGLAKIQHPAAGMYFENRFAVRELSLGAGAFVLPTSSGVFGASITYFGYELYNESKTGLAYAKSFGEKFSAGLQLNYYNISIADDFGNKGMFTFEAGAIYELLPQMHIGVHIFNPHRAQITEYSNDRIPAIFRTGISYQFSEKVIGVAETEKSSDHNALFRVGIEYQISQPIYVRGGIGTNPASNAFGFGLLLGNFQIDLASSYHHVLGYSPQISLVYKLK